MSQPHQPTSHLAQGSRAVGHEALDQVIRTTSARGWWALWTVVALVTAGVLWACFATLPLQVKVTGIIVPFAYSESITSPAQGTVSFASGIAQPRDEGEVIATVTPFDGSGAVEVRAPFTGQVDTILVMQGQGVEPGTQLATMVRPVDPEAGITVVTYTPATEAFDFRQGATAEVMVTDVATGTSLSVSAVVSAVADTPSDSDSITSLTGSAALSQMWTQEADGTPYRVVLSIQDWPSSGSTPVPAPGEIVEITSTYETVHPIQLLFGGS